MSAENGTDPIDETCPPDQVGELLGRHEPAEAVAELARGEGGGLRMPLQVALEAVARQVGNADGLLDVIEREVVERARADQETAARNGTAAPAARVDALELECWGDAFWTEPAEAAQALVRHRWLIKGSGHLLRGHYGQGKTQVAIDTARRWIEDGGAVVWLDYEMGRRKLRNRMRESGWTRSHLERWRYQYGARFADGELLRRCEELGADETLVVVDSFAGAMMMFELEENAASEAGSWFVRNIQAARENGSTVAVIEQEKQSATRSERYGRGTGAKSYAADVSWFVEATVPFSRNQSGHIRMTCKKDREGVWSLGDELHYSIGDAQGGLPLVPAEDPGGGQHQGPLRTRIILALAELAPDRESAVQAKVVREAVNAKRDKVYDELGRLATDQTEPVRREQQGAQKIVYWHDRPQGRDDRPKV